MSAGKNPNVLLATPGAWHLRNTAKAFAERGALAGLWISDKNNAGIAAEKYRRCWPYHLAMKPFYQFASQIWIERATYANFPFWRAWLRRQSCPEMNVVQSTMGFAAELFDMAEKSGALKVVDCPNSHPTTYFGYWQRECDLWCPGEEIPVPRWMFARMNQDLARADLILCPSLFVRDTMVLNGISAENCLVNPFGVNTDIFKPRNAIPATPKFVAIGTICVRKGFQYLFRAFEIVRRQIPEAELIVVGDYKTDFRCERPKWEGTFIHYPSLSHPELAKLLQTCTAFVFPSLEEGFARVISEAMAAGLPILGSYESGATTLVDDGVEGFVVRARDPQHIAEAMLRVARDRELCRRMGEAAHKKGAVKNSWQDYGDRLLAEYARRLSC
jgi:glycosyltransferase involved in cell wall biosynthesis